MEKVIQYFIEQLCNAENPLMKLSVVTALYESFLTEAPSCKVAASTNKLIECLLDILEKEFGFDGESKSYSPYSNKKCGTDTDCKLDKSAAKRKSKSKTISAVGDLLKLMSLKCIYEFSKNKENVNGLGVTVQKSILSFLARICDLEKSRNDTDCFRFSLNFTKCIKKYTASLEYRLKVKVMPESNDSLCNLSSLKQYLESYGEIDTADNIHQICQNKHVELHGLSIVESSNVENSDCNLLNMLVAQQVAWGRGNRYSSHKSEQEKEGKGSRKSIVSNINIKGGRSKTEISVSYIHKVLSGNLMWVNLGKDSIQSVEYIQSQLEQELKSNTLRKNKNVKINDIVAAFVHSNEVLSSNGGQRSKMMIMRGKVLSVNSDTVTVFGIDVGDVFEVPASSIFLLPSDLSTSAIPQQVALAYLHDVSPTPVEISHVELSLAAMHNFCRADNAITVFLDLNLLPVLHPLMTCGDCVIASHVMRLATILTRFHDVDSSEKWCHILLSALECLNMLLMRYSPSENCTPQKTELQSTGLSKESAAPNRAEDTADIKQKIPPKKGPQYDDLELSGRLCPTLERISSKVAAASPEKAQQSGISPTASSPEPKVNCKVDFNDITLIASCVRLLGNLIHKNQPMKEVFYHQNGLESVLICQRILGNQRIVSACTSRLLFNFVNTYSHVVNTPGRSSIFGEINNIDSDSCGSDFDENSDIELDLDNSSQEEENSNAGFHQEGTSPYSVDGEKDSRLLIKGSIYPHFTNPHYEMLEGLDWTSQSLCAIVCGMLNSGQVGTICVGIGKGGEVRGEKVTHDMRDELRLGMDDLMARLIPNIMHFQLEIQFVPVVDDTESKELITLGNVSHLQLYVIEIVCNPIHGVIHTLKNEKAYYRTGSKTILVNEQDIRHLIIIDEEQKFMDEILDLQKQLQILTGASGEE